MPSVPPPPIRGDDLAADLEPVRAVRHERLRQDSQPRLLGEMRLPR